MQELERLLTRERLHRPTAADELEGRVRRRHGKPLTLQAWNEQRYKHQQVQRALESSELDMNPEVISAKDTCR